MEIGFETRYGDRHGHAADAEHVAHGLLADDEALGKRTGLNVSAEQRSDAFIQHTSADGEPVGPIGSRFFGLPSHERLHDPPERHRR